MFFYTDIAHTGIATFTINFINNVYIITDWYQKQTFSGRYLNYRSQQPHCNKIVIIYSLIDTVVKLSHTSFDRKNITYIKELLLQNNYSQNVIEVYIKKRLSKLFNTHNNVRKNNKKRSFIALPYVKELENFINYFFFKTEYQCNL